MNVFLFLFLAFMTVASFLIYCRNYYRSLKTSTDHLNRSLKKIKDIFNNISEVTFYGSYQHGSYYHIRSVDRSNSILRIQDIREEDKIEFAYINENQWYKTQPIQRYDGDIVLSIDKTKLRFDRNIFEKFISKFFRELDMMYNKFKNKKILFDEFYEGMLDMRHKNKGDAYTISNYDNVQFIINIFNERTS